MSKWKKSFFVLGVLLCIIAYNRTTILRKIVDIRVSQITDGQDFCWGVPRYLGRIAGEEILPIGYEYQPDFQSVWWNFVGYGSTRVSHFGIYIPQKNSELVYKWEYRRMNFRLFTEYSRGTSESNDYACQHEKREPVSQ